MKKSLQKSFRDSSIFEKKKSTIGTQKNESNAVIYDYDYKKLATNK